MPILSSCTAQDPIHLEFNLSLLILAKIYPRKLPQ